jgi:hypothetical protein
MLWFWKKSWKKNSSRSNSPRPYSVFLGILSVKDNPIIHLHFPARSSYLAK